MAIRLLCALILIPATIIRIGEPFLRKSIISTLLNLRCFRKYISVICIALFLRVGNLFLNFRQSLLGHLNLGPSSGGEVRFNSFHELVKIWLLFLWGLNCMQAMNLIW